ncbi:hypothetical protein WA026_001121 [Henosepilachna vigintioctopunctata]|uniref:Uncharacterized protein n=1 Tax=Henosepilachna vigintioctopunctata TaxID=420089 RepID=A0AAW1V5X8_9CUCU
MAYLRWNFLLNAASDSDEQLLNEVKEHKETRISDRIRKRSLRRLEHLDSCDTCDPICQQHKGEATKSTIKTVPVKNIAHNTIPNVQQNIYTCACNRPSYIAPIPSPCYCSQPIPLKQKDNIRDINQLRCHDLTDELDDKERAKFAAKSYSKSSINHIPPSSPKRVIRQKEIPTKPKVTLKSYKNPDVLQKEMQNKSKDTRLLESHVEKIDDQNFFTSPLAETEMDLHEKMKQRDKEAFLRGQKALEKEKLQREYNELMRKLPVLQRLERLYEMNQDKPEYHMSEDRLREQEMKKQSILDNTYEKLFPDRQSTKITIPIKNSSDYEIGEKMKASKKEDVATLNLGVWQGEKPRKLYTEEEVQAILHEGQITSESKIRADQLKLVLERLRKQKDELLKEIHNLPEDSAKLSIASYSPELKGYVNQRTDKYSENRDVNEKKDELKIKTSHKTNMNKKNISKTSSNTNIHSSSSYETIDEPLKKHIKISKTVKSKGVQITKNSRKLKSTVRSKNLSTLSSKSSSPQKFNKKRSPEKEILSFSEQSSTDQRNSKKPNKCNNNPLPVHQPFCKKQKNIEISHKDDNHVSPELPKNSKRTKVEDTTQLKTKDLSTKPFVSCECNADTSPQIPNELCEIVIKIKDGKSSQVLVKENNEKVKNNLKSTTVHKLKTTNIPEKVESSKSTQIQHDLNNAMKDDCCQKNVETKFLSWHDKLLKNNSVISNSSTSYMSPPVLPNKSVPQSKMSINSTEICKKPQKLITKEIGTSPPTKLQGENLNMQDEIKRLLNMSRLSVEELGVSSVSSVTTPSQSVIDLDSNRANTNTKYSSINGRSSQQFSEDQSQNEVPNFSYMSISTGSRTIFTSEVDSTSEQYPEILRKYAKIADKCSQRISNLSAMIEKVREEKNRMLQTSSILTTNDSSTKYMDLPSPRKLSNENELNERTKSSSSSGSGEGSNLLTINMSLAEKLKGLRPEEIENSENDMVLVNENLNDSRTDDLDRRLKALREPVKRGPEQQYPKESEKGDAIDFIPLLLDIPKMPLLTSDASNSKHKRPPTPKGFLAARRITDCMAPHELSTIPEQDSQTRFESTIKDKSPRISGELKQSLAKETVATPKKITHLEARMLPKAEGIQTWDNHNSTQTDKSSHKLVKPKPITNIKKKSPKVTEMSDNSFCSSNTSGDEKLEMFRIEAMLRSIGMDWAISTLRKTQEALALTSSSSSLDIKSPATIKELSEADVKEFFTKQVFQKISSSTLRSDASPGSLDESYDLSEINGDFSKKKTSTPINRSRELSKTSDLPSAIESEKESKEFFSFVDHSP